MTKLRKLSNRVSGTTERENPKERGTTRGHNKVLYNTEAPKGQVLKELICAVCGERTYSLEGRCKNFADIMHSFQTKSELERGL